MNYSIKRISLDIHDTSSRETVYVKRGDTGRVLHIVLADGGMPYRISTDCYAIFNGKKPDGTVLFNDCKIENNVIIYKLTEQTVAAEGLVKCEISLYDAGGDLITSPRFNLSVNPKVYNDEDEVSSSDEFNALKELIKDVQDVLNSAHTQNAVKLENVTLYASKWEGGSSPYSQVVSVPGATGYSQVDLKPSVEQLEVFRNKDLAFVTENDGGTVTVYAIGDKPANDHTMQVSITEVDIPGSNVRLGNVTLYSSKWTGSSSPYSQVVSVPSATEYSQVDLKPSVEQLEAFRNKDLAFVTENDGGTVTVYAIGDKPANDYTMQVSITEVNV